MGVATCNDSRPAKFPSPSTGPACVLQHFQPPFLFLRKRTENKVDFGGRDRFLKRTRVKLLRRLERQMPCRRDPGCLLLLRLLLLPQRAEAGCVNTPLLSFILPLLPICGALRALRPDLVRPVDPHRPSIYPVLASIQPSPFHLPSLCLPDRPAP